MQHPASSLVAHVDHLRPEQHGVLRSSAAYLDDRLGTLDDRHPLFSVGVSPLSYPPTYLQWLHGALESLETSPGFDRLLVGLRRPVKFRAGIAEVFFASSFASAGLPVDLESTLSTDNEPGPDFSVGLEDGKAFVEVSTLELGKIEQQASTSNEIGQLLAAVNIPLWRVNHRCVIWTTLPEEAQERAIELQRTSEAFEQAASSAIATGSLQEVNDDLLDAAFAPPLCSEALIQWAASYGLPHGCVLEGPAYEDKIHRRVRSKLGRKVRQLPENGLRIVALEVLDPLSMDIFCSAGSELNAVADSCDRAQNVSAILVASSMFAPNASKAHPEVESRSV